MQIKEALNLQKQWGKKPCEHQHIEKEYHLGSATGEYNCTKCGMTKEDSTWNQVKNEPSQTIS
jgi:hypothetical protein